MKDPLFSRPVGSELWAMLIEKAWLKNIREFSLAEESNAEYVFEELLAAPTRLYSFKEYNVNNIFKFLNDFDRKDFIMTLASNNNCTASIIKGHAYSLIKTY